MRSCSLSITKEQSLGETGQSEKRGQGHSEAQVRQIYYTGGKHGGLRMETWFYVHVVFFFLSFRWFEGFNWDGLCKGTLNPPVIPRVRHVQLGSLFFCFVISPFAKSRSALHVGVFFSHLLFFSPFRLSILWTAVHVVIMLRAQWSCAQTGMTSDHVSDGWAVKWERKKTCQTILYHFQD